MNEAGKGDTPRPINDFNTFSSNWEKTFGKKRETMIRVFGQAGLVVTIIQDSISPEGKRIITYELEYHRYIHAEFMTHRVFSRNAASSRAIPIEKMHQHIMDNPARPIVWQKNQAGMQSKEELLGNDRDIAQECWDTGMYTAIETSKELMKAGLHKQWANRGTEAYQMMKTVMTTTEDVNWDELRNHEDAQPEIHELARCMKEVKEISSPMKLAPGEWHVPYVNRVRIHINGPLVYQDSSGKELSMQDAIKVSASCCAQVSYRKSDESLDKALAIFDRLINSVPRHASPVEHQATPMKCERIIFATQAGAWEEGVTHINRQGYLGSGNFYSWIQYRQLI